MTTYEIERLLRRPAPDEPAILPALILPLAAPGLGAVRGRVGSGRTGRSIGFLSPRLAMALVLLLGALAGAIATGALRLDRLTNPLDPNAVFGGGGISIDYPRDWTRLTPDNPFGSSGANTILVVSSAGVDACADHDQLESPAPEPVPSDGGVDLSSQQGTIYGLEDRIFACVIEQQLAEGEIRIVVTRGMPQRIGVGPFGDFDPGAFFEGDNPEFAFYIPTATDGWTESIDGMPAKLVVSPTSVTPGAEEVRTWIVLAPGGAPWYVQVVLRGPDLEGLRTRADGIARSLRFDDHPPALDVATRDAALARALDGLDRETRLWRGSDLFGCFPRTPGSTEATIDDLLHEYGPDGLLAAPVPVTCTTTVEPTPIGLWYATLVVSWQAGEGYAAGEWGWYTSFAADGAAAGSQGQLFGPEAVVHPGTVGELPEALDGPLLIPIGSIVEVLPPGVLQTGGPIQAIFATPDAAIGESIVIDAQPGTRYGVLDGPVAAVGYDWYLVQVQHGTGYPSEILWIPSTDDGRPLLRVVAPDCPAGAPSIAELAVLQPLERIACYGRDDVILDPATAVLTRDEGGNDAIEGTPDWLAGYSLWRLYGRGGPDGLDGALAIAIDPAVGEVLPTGTWLTVTGHFDDAAAATCERRFPEEWGSQEPPEIQHLHCRELFVVTGFTTRSVP